jgi:hypothetical protein
MAGTAYDPTLRGAPHDPSQLPSILRSYVVLPQDTLATFRSHRIQRLDASLDAAAARFHTTVVTDEGTLPRAPLCIN